MGSIVVSLVTLDGVVEDPGGSEGFARGGWAFQFDRGPTAREGSAIYRVIPAGELKPRPSGTIAFEGEPYGSGVSVFLVDDEPGAGPELHSIRTRQRWIVRSGKARCTADGVNVEAGPGDVVVAGPETPHRFENVGTDRLEGRLHPRVAAAHPGVAGRVIRSGAPAGDEPERRLPGAIDLVPFERDDSVLETIKELAKPFPLTVHPHGIGGFTRSAAERVRVASWRPTSGTRSASSTSRCVAR